MSNIEDNMIIFLNNCLRIASNIDQINTVHDIADHCNELLRKKGLKSILKYEGLIEGYCIEHK